MASSPQDPSTSKSVEEDASLTPSDVEKNNVPFEITPTKVRFITIINFARNALISCNAVACTGHEDYINASFIKEAKISLDLRSDGDVEDGYVRLTWHEGKRIESLAYQDLMLRTDPKIEVNTTKFKIVGDKGDKMPWNVALGDRRGPSPFNVDELKKDGSEGMNVIESPVSRQDADHEGKTTE